jgi:MoxR-like ATPase
VLATQNPIESEGTYALPEAQVDRFMLKILVGYPSHDEELTVVQRSLEPPPDLEQVLTLDELEALQRQVRHVYVDPSIVSYTVTIANATREPDRFGVAEIGEWVAYGASPRGPISLVQAARALALLRGRDYVTIADVHALAKDALRHRLVLTYTALAEERTADDVLDAVLRTVPAPEMDLRRPIVPAAASYAPPAPAPVPVAAQPAYAQEPPVPAQQPQQPQPPQEQQAQPQQHPQPPARPQRPWGVPWRRDDEQQADAS